MSIETTGCTTLTSAVGNGWAVALLMRDDPRSDNSFVVAWDVPNPTEDQPPARDRYRRDHETKTSALANFNEKVQEQVGRVLKNMSGNGEHHAVLGRTG